MTYADRPWLHSYPPRVPTEYHFPRMPLTRLLDDAALSFPTNTALAFLGTTMTYRELRDAVDRFATALSGLGVVKGDRVAISLPNCPQNVIALFATLRLGAIAVQHNPLYTEAELRHQLVDCGATVMVCLDRVYPLVEKVRDRTQLQHVVVTSIADYLPTSVKLKLRLPMAKAKQARAALTTPLPKGARAEKFLSLLKTSEPARQVAINPETDLALLQYTGGTTGLSKGAMLTHQNLVSNAYMNRLWDTGATAGQEVTLAVLPLFHAFGLTVAMNATLLLGGTLVLLPRFDLDQVFAAIDEWKPTMFPGVPPIYKAMCDSPHARTHNLHSIRLCVSGAMKLPSEIQEQFERITGGRLVEGYGLTETSPSTHCNPLGSGRRKAGSIGLPLPGTSCKIVAQDDPSVEVPVGEPGELAISGPQVFQGYWGHEDAEGVFTDDGYVLTGDVAVMDEDGFFTIVDRKKELIIAGGFNIYPSEVEEVLMRLPGVADAAVVGVPDRYRGETVKAFVVRQPGASLTESDVVEHCRGELTAYKVPKVVEFRDSLPRTVVGKVLRRVLVEEELAKAPGGPASVPDGRRWSGGLRDRSRDDAPQQPAEEVLAPQVPDAQPADAGSPRRATRRSPAGTTAAGRTAGSRAPERPAPVTKKAAAKAPAKKAAAKKAPAAKVPAAKAPAKKAAAAKAPAKRAAAAKVPTKKAAPKAPGKKAAPQAPVAATPATKVPGTKAPAPKAPGNKAGRAPGPKAPGAKASGTKAAGPKAPAAGGGGRATKTATTRAAASGAGAVARTPTVPAKKAPPAASTRRIVADGILTPTRRVTAGAAPATPAPSSRNTVPPPRRST